MEDFDEQEPCDCGCHYEKSTMTTGVFFDFTWCCSCWEDKD